MTRRGALLSVVAVALAGALGAACAGRPETRATGLLDLLRVHHQHLRWENYGAAAQQVDAGFRPAWAQLTAQIGRISDFELGHIEMKDPPGDDARVMVRISGFRVPDMTLRTVVFRQRWRRTGDHWRLAEMEPAQAPSPLGI